MFLVKPNFAMDALCHAIQHGFQHGEGPLVVDSDPQNERASLPMGLSKDADYWAIVRTVKRLDGSEGPDLDNFQLATSPENAANGVAVDLTTPGTGMQYVARKFAT